MDSLDLCERFKLYVSLLFVDGSEISKKLGMIREFGILRRIPDHINVVLVKGCSTEEGMQSNSSQNTSFCEKSLLNLVTLNSYSKLN